MDNPTSPKSEKPHNGSAGTNRETPPHTDEGSSATPSVPNDEVQKAHTNFLVVGIGASAGGVTALEDFFDGLHGDKPNIAFVVVTHLSPEYESNLASIIQNHTPLTVVQVNQSVEVQTDIIYVIPPGKQLAMNDGFISVSDFEQPRNLTTPIDLIFRTLAESHTDWSAAIVLSGTGADGAIGLPRIKEMGGLTLAQNPEEAEYNQMPKSSIATGFVDQILPVKAMGRWLLNYNSNRHKISVATRNDPAIAGDNDQDRDVVGLKVNPAKTDILIEILALVKVRTSHNFALYKRSTLNRRIERRMQVNDLPNLSAYLSFLGSHPSEIQALLRDLLISVTNFFRDKEVWEFLETNIIPTLFVGKDSADSVVRVWIAGCATGEEAFSMAILLHEYAGKLAFAPKLQIFATDLDEHAIAAARDGSYPETISLDVSPERLHQFFNHTGRRYRVRKEVRETILFAAHDLLKDPPFSRLDLVSCRNLLIYLNRDAQEQLLSLFHFALKPEGYLVLGTSESAEGVSLIFSSFDKKHHVYSRRTLPRLYQPIPNLLSPDKTGTQAQPQVVNNTTLGIKPLITRLQLPREKSVLPDELHQNILEFYAPPSVVVDEKFDIVHLSNRAGRYLQFRGGEPSINLLRLVHPDLRLDLRSALYNAGQRAKATETRRVRMTLAGAERLVRLIVRPVIDPPSLQGYILVIFDEIDESAEKESQHSAFVVTGPEGGRQSSRELAEKDLQGELLAHQFEEENEILKGQLRTTIEQYETSLEELKASNEELQAINEELRSATEELETSREELQAVNEELLTVNQELKIKIEEVSHANSDLQNLMVSTDIATIFLNRQLRIKRYTPKIEQLFNIIPSDLDRPLAHLTHRLEYDALVFDVEKVLRDLTPITREIKDNNVDWYLMRVLPYRTLEDRIDGVVITFTDITERKKAEAAVRVAQERYIDIIESITEAFYAVDKDWQIIYINSKAAAQLGNHKSEQLLGTPLQVIFKPGFEESTDFKMLQKAMAERISLHYEAYSPNLEFWVDADIYPSQDGGISVLFRDITERKRREANLIFLAEMSEEFARLTTPEEILQTVGGKLGAYLNVSQCGFSEFDAENDRVNLFYSWSGPDMPEFTGIYRLSQFFEPARLEMLKQGETVVVDNALTDPRLSPQSVAAVTAFNLFSFVEVPSLQLGELKYELSVDANHTREWREDEITLIKEVTDRIFPRLERARAESALRESEERFRLLTMAGNYAIYSMSPDWSEMRNLSSLNFLTATSSPNRSWLEIYIPEEERTQVQRVINEAIRTKSIFELEHRVILENGSIGWTFSRAVPLLNKNGEIEEWFGSANDITRRSKAEEGLKESEDRFRTFSDLVPDLLWSNNSQGLAQWVNQRWLEYTGQTMEEALGQGWLNAISPEDRDRSLKELQSGFKQGELVRLEYRILNAAGESNWFLVQVLPFRDEQDQIVRWYGAATDIQEQRLAQDKLELRIRQRTAELERVNKTLQSERKRLAELSGQLLRVQETERRFLARELHDEIGQYLTGIKFMLKSIKDQSFEDREKLLRESLKMVDDLTLEVQELSLNLRPPVLDEGGLVPALSLHIQRYTRQTGIEVNFTSKGLEERLPNDLETGLFRLIQEALTNVARHAGVKRVRVQILLENGEISVVIRDQGKGFNVREKQDSFTSIGLASMQERVELLGGTVTIDSVPGKGTTIMALIPRQR